MPKMSEKESTDEIPTDFQLTAVKSKPSRRYRKGSKYDPVLESFKAGDQPLVKVSIDGKDANYIRTQLNKRIDAQSRKYRNVKVSVVNNVCYLEKTSA